MRSTKVAVYGSFATLLLAFPCEASTSVFSSRLADVIAAKEQPAKESPPSPRSAVAGDVIGSALPIENLPFTDIRSSCVFVNDYDEACPYPGSTSPDVVYSYSPASAEILEIDLCQSSYDTKVFVYANAVGNLIACSDDACRSPDGNPYRSPLDCVRVDPGNTYFVVVDGYYGTCGEYDLRVSRSSTCAPCSPLLCPPSAEAEGEPRCFDGYVDVYNAGCSGSPESYSVIPCSGSYAVCGESGTFYTNGAQRDTDWYQLDVASPCDITVTLCPSFDARLAVIEILPSCGIVSLCGDLPVPQDFGVSCTYAAPAGRVWFFVAPINWSGVPCGSPYVLEVACCATNAAATTSWGRLKGLYR
jgi:hypothetical protein